MTEAKSNDPTGATPRRTALPETTDQSIEYALEPALTEAIALARAGDWPGAENVVHACFRTLPPAALSRAYISAVALAPRLLANLPADSRPGSSPALDAPPRRPESPPRLVAIRDPAFDYAHAVLTALRGRLAVPAAPVRQAS